MVWDIPGLAQELVGQMKAIVEVDSAQITANRLQFTPSLTEDTQRQKVVYHVDLFHFIIQNNPLNGS